MILELCDIRIDYTVARDEVLHLLKGVNLTVEKGRVTALVGGNGTGKTTLLNIISGFEKGFSGQLFFEDHNVTKLSAYEMAQRGVGRLFQGRQLMNELTLMEYMKMASGDKTGERPLDTFFHPKKVRESELDKEEKAIEVLKHVFGEQNKYLNMLNKKASEFSYGEQRLLAMASLLMGNNRLLLLDEPTSGVNPKHIDSFQTIIRDMAEKKGMSILLIEHNMQFVRNVADNCQYLSDGVIIKSGSVHEVLDDNSIRMNYMGL